MKGFKRERVTIFLENQYLKLSFNLVFRWRGIELRQSYLKIALERNSITHKTMSKKKWS